MQGIKWGRVDTSIKPDTIIIVASGPSLENFNFQNLRGKGFIIAVNDAAKHFDFADAWFTLDPWGLGGKQLPPSSFQGKLYAAVPEDFGTANARIRDHQVCCPRPITYLHRIVFNSNIEVADYYTWGMNEDTSCINTLNSAYGAFNMAYHMRPKKIVLLGVDATNGYFYDVQRATRSLAILPLIFDSTLPQIEKAGIEVINGSINSQVTTYPRMTIMNALAKI